MGSLQNFTPFSLKPTFSSNIHIQDGYQNESAFYPPDTGVITRSIVITQIAPHTYVLLFRPLIFRKATVTFWMPIIENQLTNTTYRYSNKICVFILVGSQELWMNKIELVTWIRMIIIAINFIAIRAL